MQLEQLIELGFDRSETVKDDEGYLITICRCSQCQAMTINGIPTHERGCPNQTHDCAECESPIKRGLRLCESCANPESIKEDNDHEED